MNRVGIPSSCWMAITMLLFATAVELSNDETGKIDGGVELARLGERVTSSGGVNDEKPLVGASVVFGEAALNFPALPSGVFVCKRPAVSKEKLDVTPIGRLVGLATKRGRVGIVLAADHFNL